MYEPLRSRVLALLKVPPKPHPPAGDPASLRVFNAGRNYFRMRLATWTVAQLLALGGILFWAGLLLGVESLARDEKAAAALRPASVPTPAAPGSVANPAAAAPDQQPSAKMEREIGDRIRAAAARIERIARPADKSRPVSRWAVFKRMGVELGLMLPDWAFPWIWALKMAGFAIYLVQIPITYAVRRLDYEMRWYMVTDRSLRIRHGVWKVSESTMSFANVQQVVVSQHPIQRLLGLANVEVKSAGGGAGPAQQETDDMHLGVFHSVTNASEIRDLILDRLRQYRATGLGDPDERSAPDVPLPPTESQPALAAAQELLLEAKALRATLR